MFATILNQLRAKKYHFCMLIDGNRWPMFLVGVSSVLFGVMGGHRDLFDRMINGVIEKFGWPK